MTCVNQGSPDLGLRNSLVSSAHRYVDGFQHGPVQRGRWFGMVLRRSTLRPKTDASNAHPPFYFVQLELHRQELLNNPSVRFQMRGYAFCEK